MYQLKQPKTSIQRLSARQSVQHSLMDIFETFTVVVSGELKTIDEADCADWVNPAAHLDRSRLDALM